MNPRRILFIIASTSALAVSAGVIVVALAFALYAAVKPMVGPAGGAAVVAGAAALLIGVLGLAMAIAARPPKPKKVEPTGLVDQIAGFIREKPVSAIVGALAVGLLSVSNPRYLGAMVRAFVEGRDPPGKGRR